MLSSRTKFLFQNLKILGFNQSIKALKIVIKSMGADSGFSRHDGSHYYHHLVDVTQTLVNFGVRDEDIITAALLHDYIEDVEGVTQKMVASLFNENVAHMVALVTKVKGADYHNDSAAMNGYLKSIYENEGAALIKTADRVHNFTTMRGATSLNHKRKQVKNTNEFFIPFFKQCRNAYPEYAPFFFHAKTTIEALIYSFTEIIRLEEVLEPYL